MLIEKNFSYFFNSSTASGALNKSADGSSFQVELYQPLTLPNNTKYASMSVIQSNIWNNSYNISSARGNNKFSYLVASTPHNSTIPDGQYTVTALQNFITLQLIEDGFPGDRITITGDESTSKIILYVAANYRVDFTITDSVREILGFDSQVIPVSPSEDARYEYGESTASFNYVNSYQIRSSIVSNGIPTNANGNSIIANIPITSPPNSLIVYSPINPTEIDITEIVGSSKQMLKFDLLNQDGETVSTNGEDYSFTCRFRVWVAI